MIQKRALQGLPFQVLYIELPQYPARGMDRMNI
jgi:hypothetical protein